MRKSGRNARIFYFYTMEKPAIFGLVGKNISYSFSRAYFSKKFDKLGINCQYLNFDIDDISRFPKILSPDIKGLNVTIPYKKSVIPYMDELSDTATQIGAVNTIQFKNGKLIGHNTDHYGFRESLRPLIETHHKKALILGTGGASKAIAYALENLGIGFTFVSRNADDQSIGYESIGRETFEDHQIIINTTPVGKLPDTEAYPDIPYEYFSSRHIAYDLVYNPEETVFLAKAKSYGAKTKNGLEMLQLQAEKAWEIWSANNC